ncbi:MAG: glycosyltransferase [Minwuia sp.]|nr:glycosyltransferase [Minwuia sp.]
MRIFLSSGSFDRSYGGPAYSVSRLGRALADAGVSVGLWAPDGSAVRSDVVRGSEHQGMDRLIRLEGSLQAALEAFGNVDVFHDSGLWWSHNHAISRHARQSGTPVVVSTRGMLAPWAMRHKHWRKKVAWQLYQRRDLMHAAAIHATSPEEAGHVAALNLGHTATLIPNGADLPTELPPTDTGDGRARRTAVFLGRLHPVKGLPLALEAWQRVRPDGWDFAIAGPDEDGYRAVLQDLIAKLALDDCVRLTGAVDGDAKTDLLRRADLFLLPSHSESFGMVVAEALAHSLPVLTTHAVPWPDLERTDCGWRVPASVSGLADGLSAATALSDQERAAMGDRGHDLIRTQYSWESVARRFLDLYSSVLTGFNTGKVA